ncbi:MAG: tetratricopeptide repeat protein, partial [Chitinivibrionales bacterium]|nr:tetratricopeptide repeat protein [Chitinivibrionales bacterium]MBD3395705.1 tetratricopeptide repeat protein [Chitinivibrionales bacterium]
TMESGMALGIDTDYSRLAGMVAKEQPYHFHVLHALARSYMARGQAPTALSVLQSALRSKPRYEVDEGAYRELLLTTARAHFQNGEFDKALERFFALLDKEEDFEEALYGIAWCYIRLGKYEKAETTLRKLINQNPSSPLAAEAILLMARRYVNKAQYEWKKITYLSKEHGRLKKLADRLAEKIPADSTGPRVDTLRAARAEIESMVRRIETEQRADHDQIASQYGKALTICEMVQSHYETGSFQEMSFSESREKLLHELDSLLLAVGGDRAAAEQRRQRRSRADRDIAKVKDLVKQSRLLAAEIEIDQYRWERAYLQRKKTSLAAMIRAARGECDTAVDSAVRAQCPQKQRRLVARMDSLIALEEATRSAWYDRLTVRCARLLETPLDTADEIYLRYHLGELYYEKENEVFAARHEAYEEELTRYENQMALFRDGKLLTMPAESQPPRLSHEQSMRQYMRVVEKYPNHEKTAPVRYSLAWCFSDLGRLDSAVLQMTVVARDHPQSQFAPQAWMYLGENYFDAAKLDNAIEAYQSVMKYPESEWFDEALYKLAWAQYRKSNPGKAISSFLALVDLGEGEASGKALLEKESLDYIAISFSESDVSGEKGLEQAAMFVDKLGDPDRGTQILHRLANVYRDQGRFEMAKSTYRTLLQMYPDNRNSPHVESEFLSVLDRDLDLAQASRLKTDFFEKYNRNGSWAKTQTDTAAVSTADSLAARHLYDASVSYHQLALQGNDQSLYRTAANRYKDYIRAYPKSHVANECHYNLAEILFSLGSYQNAAEEYIAVSKRYPDSKYRETAAWNAIVASQNLLKQEESKP